MLTETNHTILRLSQRLLDVCDNDDKRAMFALSEAHRQTLINRDCNAARTVRLVPLKAAPTMGVGPGRGTTNANPKISRGRNDDD